MELGLELGPGLELGLGLDPGLGLLLKVWWVWRWASLVCLWHWLSSLVLVGYLRDMAFSDGIICSGTNLLGGGTIHSPPLCLHPSSQ